MIAALIDGLICVQVAPPSGERQTPRAYEPAYTTSGFVGSSASERTPRGEQVRPLVNSVTSPTQSATLTEPSWMKLHDAPPFVDLYKPHFPAPGTGRVMPEQQTDDIPRKAVVTPT